MTENASELLDQPHADQVARTSFTNMLDRNVMPNDSLVALQEQCIRQYFPFNYEEGSKALSLCLSHLVHNIYHALTGQELVHRTERHTSFSQVASDFSYRLGDKLHILGEAKSPKAFNHFIGKLVEQIRDGSPIPLCSEPVPTAYGGYKAILHKVRCNLASLLSEPRHLYL